MTNIACRNLALLFFVCAPCAACRKSTAPAVSDTPRVAVPSSAAPAPGPSVAAPAALSTQSSVIPPATVLSAKSGKSIHDVDVEGFVTNHYSELDPDLENLKDECGEGQDPIRSVEIQYGDVDGDGQDEALYQGFTCVSGSAGVDYAGIVKLQPNGKLVELPIAKIPEDFKGRNPFEGLRGHVRWELKDGRFVEIYPVYKGDECEARSEGGERKFVFRWDGHRFVLDDIIDISPDQAGK
jgi:hypothetical protein